jgi:hypothetical protein
LQGNFGNHIPIIIMQDSTNTPQKLQLTLQSDVQKMDLVKGRIFVLVYKVVDTETLVAQTRKRINLDFSIRASSFPSKNYPNLLEYKDAGDYTKQITDGDGDLACTLVIKEVSRKYDTQGLVIVAKINGTDITSTTPPFKVTSKRKRVDGGKPAKKGRELTGPAKRVHDLTEQVTLLQERIAILESKQQQ